MHNRRNIVIDTDPGHDDAIAIMSLMAEPERINILGICTVAGNQSLEKVTDNLRKIVDLTKSNVPIASGEPRPLRRELATGEVGHGESGMEGPVLPPASAALASTNGVAFLAEKIHESPEKVTIVALGPLTNIALLLEKRPEVKANIEMISMMGGGIARGNMTPAAEFNMFVDPDAAKAVFASGVPITMSGLDVTEKAMIYPNEWEPLRSGGTASRFTVDLLDFYFKGSQKFGFDGSAMHDACAAMWLLYPELFSGKDLYIDVEADSDLTRGMTLADLRPVSPYEKNAHVLFDVDRSAFVAQVLKNLRKLDTIIASR